MKSVSRIRKIREEMLDRRHYTESLLAAAEETGLFSAADTAAASAAVLDLLAARLSHLTKNKSCTVRMEIAQLQLQNLLYVLDTYLLGVPYPDDAAEELKNTALSVLFERGQNCIRRRVYACEMQYRRMLPLFRALPDSVFRKTAVDGIAAFFTQYQPDTWPCEIHITADYPLYLPCDSALCGITFIAAYLQGLTDEAQFLSRIRADVLKRILLSDDKHYTVNADNLFRPVYATLMGMILLHKPFPAWKHGLSEEDLSALAELYPTEEMMMAASETLCDYLMLGARCADYCRRASGKLLSGYRAAQRHGVIRRAFPLCDR